MCAVAIIGDQLFTVRTYSKQVAVYDTISLTFQRYIRVPATGSILTGLAGCASNHCLYMSNWWYNRIQRVDVSVESTDVVKCWPVSTQPAGLSVNTSCNVVVACWGENKLQEYTTHGSLVREICLQAGMTDQWHAMQLSSGNYVVTTSDMVRVIGAKGQVLHSCGEPLTTDTAYIPDLRCLGVIEDDKILVDDLSNNRILALNSSLCSVQELALPVEGRLRGPSALDEVRRRLYVGEYDGHHRVLVFEMVARSDVQEQ